MLDHLGDSVRGLVWVHFLWILKEVVVLVVMRGENEAIVWKGAEMKFSDTADYYRDLHR